MENQGESIQNNYEEIKKNYEAILVILQELKSMEVIQNEFSSAD